MRAPVGLALLALLSEVHAETPLYFFKATEEIRLDGRLDEPAWREATVSTRFFEVYPGNIATPRAPTEVRFLYDDEHIYVAVRAYDPNPRAIRSNYTRRDEVDEDQDYVEVLLDPLDTRRNATVFRTNANGVLTDGLFDEEGGTRDFSPDFNFDACTSIDDGGWTAEFRIPLSSLRYGAGFDQSWAFVIYRNLPREITSTISSAPIPRASNCVLCYADVAKGISVEKPPVPIDWVPHVVYSRNDNAETLRAGIDVKWQVKPDTVVDFTLLPDFSQVEADDLRLTANQRFALSLIEKRPFFLESSDLMSTSIPAVYTRAFTDPDIGALITHRGNDHEYTALLLRDAGGGTVIEPGPIASSAGLQDFESTALVGRHRFLRESASFGSLASMRLNDDGSRNAVFGVDTTWMPTTSDRITAQLLWSQTRNPNRPDLLASWDGRDLSGAAGYLRWYHTADSWYTNLTYRNYSHDFRAWHGFVTQVGTSTISLSSGLYFYPNIRHVTRISPLLSISDVGEAGGSRLSRTISPGISFEGARDTTLYFSWSPNSQDITPVGLRSYDSWTASLSSTPFSWMPGVTFSFSGGETLDSSTGEVGDHARWTLALPLRLFGRLELDASTAYQALDSRRTDLADKRLFTERNFQVNAIWHFNSKLYTQVLHQHSELELGPTDERPDGFKSTSRLSTFLLSYQANWQTRYYVGVRQSENEDTEAEIFAKLSYVL